MSTLQKKNRAIVTNFNREFIGNGNLDVFDQTISPDFINRTPHEGRSPGPDGARYFFTQILRPAFPDLKVTIHDQICEDDKVVTRKSYEATHTGPFKGIQATGKKVAFSVIDIIRLRDRKYVAHWAVADMFGLLAQLR